MHVVDETEPDDVTVNSTANQGISDLVTVFLMTLL